jgi:CDP-diacylglycerol--glycerol-3-phosphate 3-phosphatidyltransferase
VGGVGVRRPGYTAPRRGGKAKTVAQSLAIFLYILPVSGVLASVRWWVMAVAVVLTVVTGIDYVYRALALRRTSARATREAAERRAARAVQEPAPGTDPAPRPDTTAA